MNPSARAGRQVGSRALVVTKEEPNSLRKIVKVYLFWAILRNQLNVDLWRR